jgi:hypothetical protein
MLGMIDDFHDGDVDVNYALSDQQVYINVVTLFVGRYHSVEFLREATLGNMSPDHGDFPTWLPDWSQTSTMNSFGLPDFSIAKLHANAKTVPSPPAKVSQGLLKVKGFRIGSVALLLPEVQQERLWAAKLDIPDLVAKFRSFKALSDDIDTPVPTDQTPSNGYRIEYLFRAVTGADGRDIEHRRFQKYSELFENLISASTLAHDNDACTTFSTVIHADPAHFGDLVHYMQESCRGRHFFLTKDLCMGLVPQPASVGDEIWYIIGCTTPIILRNENRRCIVIGEAYVNDCMQWKAADGVLETPGGVPLTDYQIQDLTLR